MADIEQDVNELYNRAEEIRQQAQLDSRSDSPRGPDKGKPRRRLANRIVMFVIGAGMVTYGVINLAARMMYEGAGPPPSPSLGTFTSTLTVSSCEAGLQSLEQAKVTPTKDASQGLNADEAEQAADSLLRRYLHFDSGRYPVLLAGPTLVDVELPDGTMQQAWARLWIPDVNPVADDMTDTAEPVSTGSPTSTAILDTPAPLGTVNPTDTANQTGTVAPPGARGVDADVIYISAATGDPIALVQALKVQDPLLAGCQETAIHEISQSISNRFQSLPSLIFNIALLVVGVITLLSWQRSR